MRLLPLAAAFLGLALVPAQAAEGWGAISVEIGKAEGARHHGLGTGATQDEAVARGQESCRGAGGTACQPVVTFRGCAAYAASRSDATWGKAASRAEAEATALTGCKGECRIVAAGCT